MRENFAQLLDFALSQGLTEEKTPKLEQEILEAQLKFYPPPL